ncbi:MAG: LPXTG cell wall anchor domain-containing protein, partial [Bacteroidales bacterium]
KTGTWTVVNVQAPNFATVRFEDGSVERYAIPKGTTFAIDGQPKTAFDLRPGMKITATRIVLTPAVDVTKTAQVAGTAPKPATPPMEGALLIAAPAPSSAPTRAVAAASEPAPAGRRLPKTGSVVPLIGLLGLLFSGASIGVRVLRRS